jgi:hypothetical protein
MMEEAAPVSMTKGNGPFPSTHTLANITASEWARRTVIGTTEAPLARVETPVQPVVRGGTGTC